MIFFYSRFLVYLLDENILIHIFQTHHFSLLNCCTYCYFITFITIFSIRESKKRNIDNFFNRIIFIYQYLELPTYLNSCNCHKTNYLRLLANDQQTSTFHLPEDSQNTKHFDVIYLIDSY